MTRRYGSKKNKPYFKLLKVLKPEARATATPWTVSALCTAYNWPTNLAGGGVIAIVELGGGWVQSDMTEYFQSIGQPVP
jgi:kumamolisin